MDEVADDALVIPTAGMGTPTVGIEKLPHGDEHVRVIQALESFLGRPVTHTVSIEAGGSNSTVPFRMAAKLGIPVVDADGMGQAFPEIQIVTATVYGIPATPMALADEKGNTAIINTIDNSWAERFSRSITSGCCFCARFNHCLGH